MTVVSLGIALVLNIQQAPTFEFKDTEKKVIIQKLFDQEMPKGTKLTISPLIKGKASVKVDRRKFELMLWDVLTPLGCTYRYEAGTFKIIPKTKTAK